jgi:hypothetical protein
LLNVSAMLVRRVPEPAFRALPLYVHAILADVPLRDVTVVDLPGGGSGRTLADLRQILQGNTPKPSGLIVKALFAVRRFLGRVFKWDAAAALPNAESYRDRVPQEIVQRSRTPLGSQRGSFETLYELETESLIEVRNATVHAFMCSALEPTDAGYRLYWAVYVRPVSWFTPVYMAAIEPFRRFIVYPAVLRDVLRAWTIRYPLPN